MNSGRRTVLIRTDGNAFIGSGHVARCAAIAKAIEHAGYAAEFVVSDDNSARLVCDRGFVPRVIGGDAMSIGAEDATRLAPLLNTGEVVSVLVDTYAVSDGFFDRLHEMAALGGARVAYIDDMFTFSSGLLEKPAMWRVDILINYEFGFTPADYAAHAERGATVLVGTEYTPLRSEFAVAHHEVRSEVKRILVTCGSTNPHRTLETITEICQSMFPQLDIDVIVGSQSDVRLPDSPHVHMHRHVAAMAPFMERADVAISAAGTTLYELCAVGLPTIAFPMVENQERDAREFFRLGLGIALRRDDGFSTCLVEALESMRSRAVREGYARRAKLAVQDGTRLIARELCR